MLRIYAEYQQRPVQSPPQVSIHSGSQAPPQQPQGMHAPPGYHPQQYANYPPPQRPQDRQKPYAYQQDHYHDAQNPSRAQSQPNAQPPHGLPHPPQGHYGYPPDRYYHNYGPYGQQAAIADPYYSYQHGGYAPEPRSPSGLPAASGEKAAASVSSSTLVAPPPASGDFSTAAVRASRTIGCVDSLATTLSVSILTDGIAAACSLFNAFYCKLYCKLNQYSVFHASQQSLVTFTCDSVSV